MKLKEIIHEIKMLNWEVYWRVAVIIAVIVVFGMFIHNTNEAREQSLSQNEQTIITETKEAKITNLDIAKTEYKSRIRTYYYVTIGTPVEQTLSVSKEEFSRYEEGNIVVVDITTTTNTSWWLSDTVEYNIKYVATEK